MTANDPEVYYRTSSDYIATLILTNEINEVCSILEVIYKLQSKQYC